MKWKIFALLGLFAASLTVVAQVLLTNLDQKSFIIDVTGQPTNVVNLHLRNTQFSSSTTGWVLTNISGVYGGSTNITTNSIWGIDGFGNITPIVTNSAVIATNIVRYGVGRMFGTESWLSKALTLTNGPNYIGAAENSQFFLIGPTTNPADCQIILSNAVATGQKLVLVNQTNAIPAEGAWTLTNNTPIPDGAGVVKLLGGYDLLSTNGYISYFEFISPDWQEVGRILASGASGLLTNVFNNIVVYSNITLKGNSTLTINNITLTTNDLWHTNLVGGAATLQPVNLGLQPLVGKGWLSGTNTPGSGLLPLALPFNVLSSVRSEDIGDPTASYMYIAQARNNNNPKSFLSFVASTNALTFQLGANDGTDQSTMNLVTANGSDIELNLQKNSTNFTLLYPTRGATLTPYHFGTDKTHTSSNIFEIANNDTNWWTFGISGAGTIAEFGLHSQSGDLSSIRATNGINFNIDVAGGYQWRMNGIGFEPEFDGSTLASNLHPINGGHFNNVIWGDGGAGVADTSGNGSPEGVAAAAVGSVWRNTNGTPGTVLYVKETGFGNTGWTAIGAGGGGTVGTVINTTSGSAGVPLVLSGTNPTNAVPAGDIVVPGTILNGKSIKQEVVAEGAYWTNGLNCISIAQNMLATYATNQYLCYINTNLTISIVVKNLFTGGLTKTTLTNSIADDDEHRVAAIALDGNGRVHVVYGSHADRLKWIVTTNSQDLTSFSGINYMIQSTNENSCTYPMFTQNPLTHDLFFTFRQGSSVSGDQFFYHWNTNSSAWEVPMGTDAIGKIIGGTTNTTTVYMNGLPKWDSHTNLWFSWSWSTTGTNENLMYWTGTSFKKSSGGAQTIPAIIANTTADLTAGNLQVQNTFCLDSNDKVFVPYVTVDATGTNYQTYVLENTTGSFLTHQLTQNVDTTNNLPQPYPYPYPGSFAIGTNVYVIQPDVFGAERGIVAFQSGDGFNTFRKFYISHEFNPNWSICYDPNLIVSNKVSFPFIHANDYTYGQIYVNYQTNNIKLGQLSLIDWIPSVSTELPKGLPTDIYGLNSIAGAHANITEITSTKYTLNGSSITAWPAGSPGTIIQLPDGTDANPGLQWQNQTNTGFSRPASGTIKFITSGSGRAYLNGSDWQLRSDGGLKWSSTTDPTATADVIMRRRNPATLVMGNTGTAPLAQFFLGPEANTTDHPGGAQSLGGGSSTGTNSGGAFNVLRSLNAEASGSTTNAYTTVLHVPGKWVALTHTTATTIETFSLPANKIMGGSMTVTCYCTNATPHAQSLTSRVTWDAVAISTTITGTISQVDNTTAADSGTLTCTYTLADNGNNTFSIQANANSSLSTPVERALVVVNAINGTAATTITDP